MNALQQISLWIQIFANFAVLVALVFTAYQIRLSLKTNEATLLQDLFDKNAELRKHFIQLRTTIPSYEELIKKCPDPQELRCLEELEPLFQIGHHYEYIGLIVKKNLIRLDLVFELIPVDKEIWENSEPVRKFLRKQYLPD